jgi:PTH1 family peptidyl-tRNA hydrolase
VIFGRPRSEPEDGRRKLVVGLGNPGRKYEKTRHNVGYEVVGLTARDWQAGKVKQKFKGETVDVRIEDESVCLLCPSTFMNRSGSSVKAAVDFFKSTADDLLVVCDDFALDLGRLRFRQKGSSGGQKGLADVIRCLGTDEFSRLRIGIGTPPDSWEVSDYVLSKFSKSERTEMDVAVRRAADAVADWVAHGTEFCMNKYNGK